MRQDANCQMLDAILDLLIPAREDGTLPGAGKIGVGAFVLAKAPTAPDLMQVLTRATALHQAGQHLSVAMVQQLEAEMPQGFAQLLRLTYMGYYSRADIRAALSLSALPVHPKGYDVAPESEALLAALTAPVLGRKGVYREV